MKYLQCICGALAPIKALRVVSVCLNGVVSQMTHRWRQQSSNLCTRVYPLPPLKRNFGPRSGSVPTAIPVNAVAGHGVGLLLKGLRRCVRAMDRYSCRILGDKWLHIALPLSSRMGHSSCRLAIVFRYATCVDFRRAATPSILFWALRMTIRVAGLSAFTDVQDCGGQFICRTASISGLITACYVEMGTDEFFL
jgi:hypothetical protein